MDSAAESSPQPPRPDRCGGASEIVRQILLARFLERPPKAIVAAIQDAEMAAWRHRLLAGRSPVIRRVVPDDVAVGDVPPGACAVVDPRGAEPAILFRTHCACEYDIDSGRLGALLAGVDGATRAGVLRAVRTLLLGTARSRITRAIWKVLARAQRAYLTTGDDSALVPLTAREVVRRARAAGTDLVDPARASRTLRATPVVMPDGTTRPLAFLCPSSRTVLAARLWKVLERERELRAAGRLRGAWNDAELARRVSTGGGIAVSRRLVCYCRKRLAVPGARVRGRRPAYMFATTGFSALHPLERESVIRRAPRAPGVYELRLAPGQEGYEQSCSGVVYVGRACDLRARLLVHAGVSARNARLARLVSSRLVLFRFRAESRSLKRVEADLYRRFCDTYGHRPSCNRLSP